MEGVEDIPGAALAEGIPWGWESFADYMDAIARDAARDRLPRPGAARPAADVRDGRARGRERSSRPTTMSPRCARSCARRSRPAPRGSRPAAATTTAPRAAQRRRPPRRRRASSPASRAAFARARPRRAPGGQRLRHDAGARIASIAEFDLLEQMAAATGGRPLSISTMQRDHAPDQWRRIFARVEQAATRGLDIRCQVGARGIGVLLGLEATFHPFMGFPRYKAIAHLPLAERVARHAEPRGARADPRRDAARRSPATARRSRRSPTSSSRTLPMVAMRLFPPRRAPGLRAEPDGLVSPRDASRADRAGARGRSTTRCSRTTARPCSTSRSTTTPGMNLDAVREMLMHPLALIGLGDGGAHVGTVCDASMPTFLLAHWARDRADGIAARARRADAGARHRAVHRPSRSRHARGRHARRPERRRAREARRCSAR